MMYLAHTSLAMTPEHSAIKEENSSDLKALQSLPCTFSAAAGFSWKLHRGDAMYYRIQDVVLNDDIDGQWTNISTHESEGRKEGKITSPLAAN